MNWISLAENNSFQWQYFRLNINMIWNNWKVNFYWIDIVKRKNESKVWITQRCNCIATVSVSFIIEFHSPDAFCTNNNKSCCWKWLKSEKRRRFQIIRVWKLSDKNRFIPWYQSWVDCLHWKKSSGLHWSYHYWRIIVHHSRRTRLD